MEEIEQIVGVGFPCLINYHLYTTNSHVNLMAIDNNIYKSITAEVCKMTYEKSINSLSVIQWINANWTKHSNKIHFITFAHDFKHLLQCIQNKKKTV